METIEEMNQEAKANVATIAFVEVKHSTIIEELTQRCGSYGKLNRVVCFIYRFIRHAKEKVRLRKQPERNTIVSTPMAAATETVKGISVPCISAAEMAVAERRLVQEAQRQGFAKELSALRNPSESREALKKILALRPEWDETNQVIQVTGRIKLALEEEGRSSLILLPAKNRIVELPIMHIH